VTDPGTIHVIERTALFTMLGGDDGNGNEVVCVMPTMKANASPRQRRAWWARAEANLTQRCPLCGEAAGVGAVTGGAAVGAVRHEDDCPAVDARLLAGAMSRESLLYLNGYAR
jgi:hypothetical protein